MCKADKCCVGLRLFGKFWYVALENLLKYVRFFLIEVVTLIDMGHATATIAVSAGESVPIAKMADAGSMGIDARVKSVAHPWAGGKFASQNFCPFSNYLLVVVRPSIVRSKTVASPNLEIAGRPIINVGKIMGGQSAKVAQRANAVGGMAHGKLHLN